MLFEAATAAAGVLGGCASGGGEDSCIVDVAAVDASIVEDVDSDSIDAIAKACDADEDVIVTVDATASVCMHCWGMPHMYRLLRCCEGNTL